MGHPYLAFKAYTSSPDAQSAPQWQIDTLENVRFDGFEPTVALYQELRAVLDSAPSVAVDEPVDVADGPSSDSGERRAAAL